MKKLSLQIISFLLHMMPLSLSYVGYEIWWNYEIVIFENKKREKRRRKEKW
jgi:hypothetical protein